MKPTLIMFDAPTPVTAAEVQSVFVLVHKGVLSERMVTRQQLIELREQHGLADDERAFVAAEAVRNGQGN